MRDGERMDTEEFAARVAAPLKAAVKLEAGFDARVMAQIAAEPPRSWWRRPVLRLSPLGATALAAGFAAVMVLSGVAIGRSSDASAAGQDIAVAPRVDTVHVVRFVFAAPGAQRVVLAGDFNGWSREATPLEDVTGSGQWVVTVALPPGLHEYAFIVDGERWMADPGAVARRDEFGNESSLLRVGGDLRRGT